MAARWDKDGSESAESRPLDPDEVAPLSNDRIISWFTRHKFRYFVDNEGDVGGLWNDCMFYFLTYGDKNEILQVRGQWNRKLSVLRMSEILDMCNQWNRERIWPMCYVRVGDEGDVRVYAETSTDLEFGVSDNQLGQLLQCGISTGGRMFAMLDEAYPDIAQQGPGTAS